MMIDAPFDALMGFAEIERLVGKIYYRFSHVFLGDAALRDFWWEMAREEEQHACILQACRAVIENYDEDRLDPSVNAERADALRQWLDAFLRQGRAAMTIAESFRIALEIESSEIDVIYGKLIHLGGDQIARTMENLGVPASIQRQKLKAALRRFCPEPELLRMAERL